ncbi:MAG TPA: tetratricopeptide repeat protein [Sphingomonas sp.]|uniref:tetratricopeptide repeat protein n=1 Tax=Sphingomonas sp. TaxID=28214 RepID=UPI002ED82A07
MIRLLGGALLLSVAGAALAADPVAFQAIAAKDLTGAARQLETELAAGSNEPGVLLNLAHVYRQTARDVDADALYRRVLATPNVQMATPDGNPAWSHTLAKRALARNAQFAAR